MARNKTAGQEKERLKIAASLSAAFIKYTNFFGEQPHGTETQMRGMIELMPYKPWLVNRRIASRKLLKAAERAESVMTANLPGSSEMPVDPRYFSETVQMLREAIRSERLSSGRKG